MARNILLTSLSAAESDLPVRYFSLRKEFGFDYCDALLDAEAGIKAVLARYDIDEVIVIGGEGACDEEDDLNPVSIRQGSGLYSEDKAEFSTYKLLRYRLAQYAYELFLEQKTEEELLPAETREKLARFIKEYQEKDEGLREVRFNRLFDALAQGGRRYEDFRDALFDAFPELRDETDSCLRWVKNYLYSELKLSAKLELLPVNGMVSICCIPEESMEDSGQRAAGMLQMEKAIVREPEDINLYVCLNGDDAGDTFIVINMLDILVSMPSSRVRLKKIFTLRSLQRCMSGIIRDDTEAFGVTELFHAIRAFLNYGKADGIVKLWEESGERSERIAAMVHAMRHVDVGLSMCNIPEIQDGLLRLRRLFRDEQFWAEAGRYGMLFSTIAESIREDYGPLLEGTGDIPFIELVKWAYRHQFYQQTLTLIESEAPEKLVRSGIFYYCADEEQKEQVTRLFALQRLELRPHEYYKMDQINHYYVKAYDRSRTRGLGGRDEDPQRVYAALRIRSVDNTDPSFITGHSACDSMETLQNLLFAYYHVGVVRNKISHADAAAMAAMSETRLMVSDSDEISAQVWMTDAIEYFISNYEKAMAEVEGKAPEVVLITSEEVRTASELLRREREPRRDGKRGGYEDKKAGK